MNKTILKGALALGLTAALGTAFATSADATTGVIVNSENQSSFNGWINQDTSNVFKGGREYNEDAFNAWLNDRSNNRFDNNFKSNDDSFNTWENRSKTFNQFYSQDTRNLESFNTWDNNNSGNKF